MFGAPQLMELAEVLQQKLATNLYGITNIFILSLL